MYDHIEDARLPIDRVLYIANALEMDLSRKKKLLVLPMKFSPVI